MKADNLRISKVFSAGGDIHYVLPHFQREYTWEKENWRTLLADALAVCDEVPASPVDGRTVSEVEHFLGSIVVIHDGMRSGTISAFKLVDGQQRLTTVALLLKAISRYAASSLPALAKRLEKLLVNADETGDLYYKILPTIKNGDRATYCALLGEAPLPGNRSRIADAFAFFEAELRTRFAEGLDPERLAAVVTNLFQVVFVELDERESPYRIFESLNAKGKPLTQADLVRNYVAMKLPARDQERVFQTHWREVEALLQENRFVSRLPELTAFLRHYLAMQTGVLCDEGHVYARFRDRAERHFTASAAFEAELAAISRFAGHYDFLLRPENGLDQEIGAALARLNALDVATGYPFLLRVMDEHRSGRMTRANFREILAVLETYLVRRYVAGEPGAYLTRMFPALYGALDPEDHVGSLKRALVERKCPNNVRLFRALETRSFYEKNATGRRKTELLLSAINRQFSAGTGGFTVLDGHPTIEHVMPQTLNEQWRSHLGLMWEQTHRDYLHSLGNLTLVTGEWNSELSNASYAVKRAKLSINALRINSQHFANASDQWTRNEIRARGEDLLGIIIEIWPSLVLDDPAAEEILAGEMAERSEFHFAAVERIAQHVGVVLKRVSDSRYQSPDGQQRLVGLCSRAYRRDGESAHYWFGFRFPQHEFLSFAGESWLALECESPDRLLLIPFAELTPLLPKLHQTQGQHWHMRLYREEENIFLRPTGGSTDQLDLAAYRL